MEVVFTWLFAIYFFLSSAILYCVNAGICLIVAPFDPLRRAVHNFSCSWAYHYLQVNPLWKVEYFGVEQIKPNKSYVIISNHQSLADILTIYGLHRQFKYVSKSDIGKVPFIGWNMKLNQYVFLERGDLKSIKEMMRKCKEWLTKGSSVMLFPEGTRSSDGRMQPFRDGAFKLALDCNVELVPMVIDGTFPILSKESKCLKFKQTIRAVVLPPINPEDFQGRPGAMRAHVFDLMAKTLADLREVPLADVISKQSAKTGPEGSNQTALSSEPVQLTTKS